jgi:hypothetical protein
MQLKYFAIPLLAITLAAAAASDVQAGPAAKKEKRGTAQKLYKWVDDKGVTHFGNKIPPEYASQGGEQIDKTGQTVRTIEAEKSGEALAEAERQRAEAEAARQAAADQARNDKVLLGTFPTVADLTRSKDAKLAAVDAQARLASGTVATLERELVKLEKQAETLKKANKPVPDKIMVDIESHRRDLLTNQRFVLERQAEHDQVLEQYEKDRKRLIELRGGN